ncbi:DUF4394 domain-containing protein [Hymenobacter tibetensis]|uniref:DUF4394 domain-containing protein n=1 Tax=Hymenobacter tibetensis TaxID=497967 RepID=A0ABY4CVN8_9BACT|nr:DUF4394 domain-containing protein [Hymenobacter tibetensis]UOG73827.1 DUF4394 domain-containing protein [Hymenobacter tibetensis]
MLENVTRWTTACKSVAFGALLAGATALPAAAQTIYGLGGTAGASTLLSFAAATPGTLLGTTPITGVSTGQTVVGLDFRPNTGELFALGYDATAQTGRLYTINLTTGVATGIGAAAVAMPLGDAGARIGFDFNPTVDRIRVVSSTGVNVRLNPVTGTVAVTDTNLAYATTDTNAGAVPGVGAVAYTNSYIGSTSTLLYDIDETVSRLLTQNPPNNGTLNTVGTLTTTTTGTGQSTDLDIYFNPTTGANTAYLSASVAGVAGFSATLYTLDLTTAATTSVGAIGGGIVDVRDIAVQITRPATLPAITGQLAYGLAGTNLLTFDTAQPTLIRTSVGITGVVANQTLVGMDVRPATNTLVALGYNATDQTATIYNVNSATGVAQPVNATPFALALGAGSIGFDFNPTVDRIRVVGANRANFRLSPIDGTVAATDGQLTYAAGDANAAATPSVGAAAYTNSATGTPPTTTELFVYDEALNVLALQSPPNNGTLNTRGATTLTATVARDVDMDIFTSGTTNTAYLVANSATNANTNFYTLDTSTGAATLVAPVGNGIAIRDIAIAAATGVVNSSRKTELATSLSLYPNPLAGEARVSFGLPRAARVLLTVTDALGRTVDTVDAGLLSAGQQSVRWSRKNQAAGIYFFRLSFDGQPAGTRQGVLTE